MSTETAAPLPPPPPVRLMSPVFLARSLLRRRHYDRCIDVCRRILADGCSRRGDRDAAWLLQARALAARVALDDVDLDDYAGAADGVAADSTAAAPRAGTGLADASKAPPTAFARPGALVAPTPLDNALRSGTSAGPGGGAGAGAASGALPPMTSAGVRPARTAAGRPFATARDEQQQFCDVIHLNLGDYVDRPSMARALFEYLLEVEANVRLALDLATLMETASATSNDGGGDPSSSSSSPSSFSWSWRVAKGRCYFRLNLLRDAEDAFLDALDVHESVHTYQLLAKVYIRQNQPRLALNVYQRASQRFPGEVGVQLCMARTFGAVGERESAQGRYQEVLALDSGNVEALVSVAAAHFEHDQPETALLIYKRLLQMGVDGCETYTNIGMCCVHAHQFDEAFRYLQRALHLADDSNAADVWYNLGHVALGMGDVAWAYQCFKLALASNPAHAAAHNNVGVLELRKGNHHLALASFASAARGSSLVEAEFNAAVTAYHRGDFQSAYSAVSRALELKPGMVAAQELREMLEAIS